MKNAESTGKTWSKTKHANLLKHSSGTYYARLHVSGKEFWRSLRTKSLTVAVQRLRDKQQDAERIRQSASVTVQGEGRMSDLERTYLDRLDKRRDVGPSTKTRKRELVALLNKTWPGFEELRPRQIGFDDVVSWRNRLLVNGSGFRPPGARSNKVRGNSPGTINRALDTLRDLLQIAVEAQLILANPVVSSRGGERLKLTYQPKKADIPDRATFQKVLAQMETFGGRAKPAADLCRGLAYSGARLAEAKALQWRHVDFDKGTLRIPGTKTDTAARTIPINPALRGLLEKLAADERKRGEMLTGEARLLADSRVFQVSEAEKSLTRACKVLNVPRLTHHDLRDVFTTTCVEGGVDVPTLAGWLGHKDGGALLMKTYNKLRNAHSHAQAAKVSFGVTGGAS